MAASDRAQYAIEIAATMTGGAQSVETLNSLTDSLLAGGKDADYFKDAITRVTQELAGIESSVNAANDALKDGQARYRELEKAADMSAKAAEKAALKHGGIVPVELYQQAEKAKAALNGEADALRKLELAAKGATSQQDALKNKLANLNTLNKTVSARLGDAAAKTGKLTGALGDLGGPLGSVGQRVLAPIKGFVELSEAFGRGRAVALAFAAGLALVAAATIGAAGAAAFYGIKMADQARSARLANEAFSATSEEAAASVAVWAQVTDATGVSSDRLRDLTKSLQGAGVSAADMPKALKATATAEAALGQGGGDEFVAQLKDAKAGVDDVANAVEAKFGGIVSRKMLGLEAQGARLQNNLSKTFGGLDIDPLLMALTWLVDLFNENTVVGKTLKMLFEALVQPLIDGLTALMPLVEGFIIGFLIGVTKIYIALQPIVKAIAEFLGFNDPTTEETFIGVANAGEVVATVIASLAAVLAGFAARAVVSAVISLGTLIASNAAAAASFLFTAATALPAMIAGLWAMIAPVLIAAAPFLLVAAAVAALGYAIITWGPRMLAGVQAFASGFMSGIGAVIDWLGGVVTRVGEIGSQIMQGLVNGILGGAGALISAITGAVGGAINAAKSLLGIASPSKLFAEIGGFTAEGFALGVEDEAPLAQAAMTDMVEPPTSALASIASPVDKLTAASGGAESPAAATQTQSAGVSLSGVTININGVEGAEDAAAKFRDMLIQLMNGTLTQAGGAA